MTTAVFVNTFTHTAAFITDKMLHSLQQLIRLSGLNPERLAQDWDTLERGFKQWISDHDLTMVTLEVWHPSTNALVGRWDFHIDYGYDPDGSGGMWVDTDAIRYSITKAGTWPSICSYRVMATTKPGKTEVPGWSSTVFRSTAGFQCHSIGTTIGAPGAATGAAYWRKS